MELRYHTHFKKEELEKQLLNLVKSLSNNSIAILSTDNIAHASSTLGTNNKFNIIGKDSTQVDLLVTKLDKNTLKYLCYQDLEVLSQTHSIFPVDSKYSHSIQFVLIHKETEQLYDIQGYQSFVDLCTKLREVLTHHYDSNKKEVRILTLGLSYLDFLDIENISSQLNCTTVPYQGNLTNREVIYSKKVLTPDEFFQNRARCLEVFEDLGETTKFINFKYLDKIKSYDLFLTLDPLTLVRLCLENNTNPSYKYQRSSQQAANALSLAFIQAFKKLNINTNLNNLEAKLEYLTKKNGAQHSNFLIRSIELKDKTSSYQELINKKDYTNNELITLAKDLGLIIDPNIENNPLIESSALSFIDHSSDQRVLFSRENFSLLKEGITIQGQASNYNQESRFARSFFLNNSNNTLSSPHSDQNRKRGNKVTPEEKALKNLVTNYIDNNNTLSLELLEDINNAQVKEYNKVLEIFKTSALALRKEVTWKQVLVSLVFNLYNKFINSDSKNIDSGNSEEISSSLTSYIEDLHNSYNSLLQQEQLSNLSLAQKLELFELKKNSKHLYKLYPLSISERANPLDSNQEALSWEAFIRDAFTKLEQYKIVTVDGNYITLECLGVQIKFTYLNPFPLDSSILEASLKENNIIYLEVESNNKLILGDTYLITNDAALRSNFTAGIPLELSQLNKLFNFN